MTPPEPTEAELEVDPRFPSGPWTGYFLQPLLPGRHKMELLLTFRRGSMTGEGRDWVGEFHVRGQYEVENGTAYWTKRYVGKHDVFYKGYNEGKGIWGIWEMPAEGNHWKGGFHIWPEGMPDPTGDKLATAADLPVDEADFGSPVREPELIPVGAGD
jgi:hypothetical protein